MPQIFHKWLDLLLASTRAAAPRWHHVIHLSATGPHRYSAEPKHLNATYKNVNSSGTQHP